MIDRTDTFSPAPRVETGEEIFEPRSVHPTHAADPEEPMVKPRGSRDARQQAKNKNKGNTDTSNYRK